MSDFLYPVALNVSGRVCIVVGGGQVGARRVESLALSGARVRIVAPEVIPSVQKLICDAMVEHIVAPFAPEHLEGAFLVIAATNNTLVNHEVALAAQERGVLLNMAADGDGTGGPGDFVTMAQVRRGHLLIGITTGGAGPALSARLKTELSDQFGTEWKEYTALLDDMRVLAKVHIPDNSLRAARLRGLVANSEIFGLVRSGDEKAAYEEARKCLFD